MPDRIEILAVIEAPHFCAGIVLWNDRVIEAANIIKYMKHWSRDRVRAYCEKKGWDAFIVYEMRRNAD